MADGSATPGYAGWRKSLRETLKWYAVTLAGVGAALAAGLTLAVLPKLPPESFAAGVFFGALVLGLLIAGLRLVSDALTEDPFLLDDLTDAEVIARLDHYMPRLTNDRYRSLSALRAALAKLPSEGPTGGVTPKAADDPLANLVTRIAPDVLSVEAAYLTSAPRTAPTDATLRAFRNAAEDLAAGLMLEKETRHVTGRLMGYFVLALPALATLAWLQGPPKPEPMDLFIARDAPLPAAVVPLLRGCADAGAPLPVKARPTDPEGWWTTSFAQGPCKGITLILPASTLRPVP
ncbi:hypothetical protein [Jannaschia sp. M317]|uniref:hypothetical protein n=1 Tax=Jannaschia sp. M317 TaxID=2867011 RepID=UPI0021A7C5D0|nr:hypothetical protein [Jannaschia sp. M317]UWQ19168.1 hypothetical protein K3551_07825 [Jannaschia sp. M317]